VGINVSIMKFEFELTLAKRYHPNLWFQLIELLIKKPIHFEVPRDFEKFGKVL